MKVLTSQLKMLEELCKARQAWGLLVDPQVDMNLNWPEEVVMAAPWLKDLEVGDRVEMVVSGGVLFFETEDECWAVFDQTVGEDGPTKKNSYDGPVRINLTVCGPDGASVTHNY